MSSKNRWIRDGVLVGLFAAAAVAVFYAFFDLIAARGFIHTVDLLGKAVFRGLRDPAILQLPVTPDMSAVLLFSAFHLAVSLAIGLLVSGLVEYAVRHPARSRVVAIVIICGFFVTVGVVGMLTEPFRALVPWWSIVLANALAVLWAGAFLVRRRPGVGKLLLHGPDGAPG